MWFCVAWGFPNGSTGTVVVMGSGIFFHRNESISVPRRGTGSHLCAEHQFLHLDLYLWFGTQGTGKGCQP